MRQINFTQIYEFSGKNIKVIIVSQFFVSADGEKMTNYWQNIVNYYQ